MQSQKTTVEEVVALERPLKKIIYSRQLSVRDGMLVEAWRIRIDRYNDSRFWGLWINDELIAVTVYRKGARAIRNLISQLM
jgi:hypothetical protein